MPVRLELTEGTTADCTQAESLTADLPAQYLLADRGYDTNAIVAEATAGNLGITTRTYIDCVIWWRMHS